MPVATPTTLTAVVNNNNSHGSSGNNPLTTASASPSANALIIAISAANNANQTFSGFSSTFATGGWTTAVQSGLGGSSSWRVTIGIAIATGSPGSGTVTATWAADIGAENLFTAQIASGFNSTTPVRPSSANHQVAASGFQLTENLLLSPNSGSILICGGVGGDDNFGADSCTAYTGWTELEEFGSSGDRKPNIQYVAGSNGAAFGIIFENSHDASTGIAIAAIEVQEPAAGDTNARLLGGDLLQSLLFGRLVN